MFNKNIDNEALTVGSVLLPILEKLGIDTIFGIPGVHTVEIYLTIRSPKEVYPKARKVRIQNGESPYGSNITISNPDKFHRETYFVSVHTRNLAIPQVAVASSGQSISVGSGYNK